MPSSVFAGAWGRAFLGRQHRAGIALPHNVDYVPRAHAGPCVVWGRPIMSHRPVSRHLITETGSTFFLGLSRNYT